MAFLRSGIVNEVDPQIETERLWLRPPVMADYAAWADIRARSKDHLTPWEPAWTENELTRWAFRRRLRIHQRDQREDLGYAFFIFSARDNHLVGGLTLSNVRRGVTQAAALGYWVGAPYARRGLMTEAVRAVIPFAFDGLELHRLEAACLPNNLGSIKVLENNGFQREGLARKYLKINAAWQDHILFSLLCDEVSEGP
ncbi:MAG: GNAT family protein [Pseudomonadota bacterium]